MNNILQFINTGAMVVTAFFSAILAIGVLAAYLHIKESQKALKAQFLLKLIDE